MELTITERAQDVVRTFMDQSDGELRALRIAARPGGVAGPRFELTLVADSDRADDDVQVDMGDFLVLVSRDSADRLEGATVDFVERVNESGFEIRPGPRRPQGGGPAQGSPGRKGQGRSGGSGEPRRSSPRRRDRARGRPGHGDLHRDGRGLPGMRPFPHDAEAGSRAHGPPGHSGNHRQCTTSPITLPGRIRSISRPVALTPT